MKIRAERITKALLIAAIITIAATLTGAAVIELTGTTYDVSNDVTYHAPNGPAITTGQSLTIEGGYPFTGSNTVVLNTSQGNATFTSTGQTNATVTKWTGTWTNTTNVDAQTNNLTINPEDKQKVTIGGNVSSFNFTAMALSDGTADFQYSGTSGGMTVTIHNLPASTTIAAVDTSQSGVLDVATSDSSGTATFNLPTSSHTVKLLNKDTNHAPTLSNPSPTGGVTSSPSTISIDVNDQDFPDDNVTVTISFNGTQIHEEEVTSNSTITTSNFTADELGTTYSWSATATDAYGNTDTSSNSFTMPGNVTFRNETNPPEIVTGVNATITFYSVDGNTVVTRSDTDNDGNISLSGLPDTEFVVAIETNDFYDRRVYIESIFQQNTIFLLNETAYPNAVFTEFELDDRTGNYPPGETTLRVQRAVDVDGDNTSEWQTVAGDFFGATNRFPFTGQYQTRYRLVVENRGGDRRILGSYTPTVGGVQPVPIGTVKFTGELKKGTAFQSQLSTQDGDRFLEIQYLDTAKATTELTYQVVRADNESNVIISNTTLTDVGTETVVVHNMTALDPSGTDSTGYKVNYWTERSTENTSGHAYAGDVRNFVFGLDIDVRHLLAWTFIVAFAGVTALFNPKLSMITTPVVALAFTITSILAIPDVLIALAFVEGGLLYYGETGGPR